MKSLELLGGQMKEARSSKKKNKTTLEENSEKFIISGCENIHKKKKKDKKIQKQKFYGEQLQAKITSNSSINDSFKEGASKTDSSLHGHIGSNVEGQRMIRKKKKKKGLLSLNHQSETDVTQTFKESPLENAVEGATKIKRKKKRMYMRPKEESCSKDNDDMEPLKKKRKLLNPSKDEYYPGMLSEMLQIKKFGRLIIPWDPSFGLDPNYKIPECNEEGLPKLKINPLFDLSKRNDQPLKDNSRTSIFVGNLPNDTNIIKLKKLFRKCGLVLHAKIRKREYSKKNVDNAKRDMKDKKYSHAVVKFSSFESCEAALKMNGELYEGHHLRITLANDEKNPDQTKTVFIGNLSFSVEDDDLWKAFGECGPIESVRVIRDERSGKGKGFGYVNFKSVDSVENAVKLDGCTILSREVRVRRHESGPSSLSDSLTIKRRKKKKKKKFVAEVEPNLELKREKNEEESKSKDKLKTKKKKKLLQVQEIESAAHEKSKKKKKLHKKASSNQMC